ncbi:tRNA uridine-5-carboxymethylaminomethyl(34) synthesis GTPase MnmE [Mycoplasma sp. 744]|uniref:tRNA uridine-5-carboxymethylaminomethyl(34) synthesis GTPase MnmE n=1 Tax=Mycoplasma sp. 744 TaxID=3108531 RepID=UPI002B1E5777|nr:tRNA uridine-5-carboxymethylaminomethyl(34) synthesis GTPase MnmE [Mycoplasma sp. 744]MEA4115347.1 tRNA uridine-5-carboxymethylaminomethyl(34) synthesis GTPase MnmE [Mycoplasma sp. 744]
MINDTIAAISSGGKINQAISIIRISGNDSVEIVKKIFTGKVGNNREITYGNIIDNFNDNFIIDEVLIAWFIGTNTFTGENTVEINCHGGIIITNKILELILANGARLAQPGEFSRRAFLNGKMDLIKAEAINDLIHAKTLKQTELAIKKFDGKTSLLIQNLINKLVYLIGAIEVNIDYPEYDDVENALGDNLKSNLYDFKKQLEKIIQASQNSRMIFEGIKVAILGKPNVGKSSILNCLLGQERAIVTDEAGTTRDIIEASYQINGVLFKLIDTAGLRKTTGKIENIGIDKTFETIKEADLILHVLDPTQSFNEFDNKIEHLAQKHNKKLLKIINKKDLMCSLDNNFEAIYISALNNDIEALENKLSNLYNLESLYDNDLYFNNTRQLALIYQAYENILEALKTLENNLDSDLVIIDLRRAWANLADITGRADNEDLLDEMFKNFCLGK